MTKAKGLPFVPRHTVDNVPGWRNNLKHVANLRSIVHRQGISALNLSDLLDYEVRLALIASLFSDEKATLYGAVAHGAGVAHAGILSQRQARSSKEGTLQMAEPGQPALRFEVDEAIMAAPDWLAGLSLALIARDHAAVNTLATPASIEACAQPTETIDPFWQPYCAAFAAALVEPEAAVRWVEIAVGALGEVSISDPARVEQVHYPLLPLLASLAQRNVQAFNAALLDALQRLQAYYAHPDQYRDWNGFFSLPLNGLCAAAFDAGLPIEVESDYLLNDLISGNFPRQLTAVTLHYPARVIADADEARWFLDLEGIPRQHRQHRIVEREGQVVARYEIRDAPGLSHAVADFILPPSDAKDAAVAVPALDAGELVYLAEVYSSAAGDDPQGRAALQDAIHCVELALRRLPTNVNTSAFPSRRGRELYQAEPGRFDRERLNAYLDSLKQSLARLDESLKAEETAPSSPPKLSEEEGRAGALVMLELIRAQVMPLLEALAHDEEGIIVAQIKPRDEDYGRVFVGEAAAIAQETYTVLWRREPPRTAQSGLVEVKSFLAPAGMLADENDLSHHFPQGYRGIAQWLQPQRIWVAWKYLKPGAQSGEAYNGLVWVEDHWAWFPKPFRVLRELAQR
jgi:hypothetical protein